MIPSSESLLQEPAAGRVHRHDQQQPFRPLQFDNPQLAFASKSTGELMRAYAVFTACQVHTPSMPLMRTRLFCSRVMSVIVASSIFVSHFWEEHAAGEHAWDAYIAIEFEHAQRTASPAAPDKMPVNLMYR